MKTIFAAFALGATSSLGLYNFAKHHQVAQTRKIKDAYFLEFEADTLYGCTAGGIEDQYDVTSLVQGKEHGEYLLKCLDAPQRRGKLVPYMIRLRIDLEDGRTYLVDKYGVVRSQRGDFKLNMKEFADLKLNLWLTFPKVLPDWSKS